MLDYGYNFTKTPIFIDNTTAMFIIKNHVQHSKTKHIEIIYHLLRDNSEKALIELLRVDTEYQLADLFTKAFDSSRFEFLVQATGMINMD
jgi:secreted Zn-dependent insulinase-like peptidase